MANPPASRLKLRSMGKCVTGGISCRLAGFRLREKIASTSNEQNNVLLNPLQVNGYAFSGPNPSLRRRGSESRRLAAAGDEWWSSPKQHLLARSSHHSISQSRRSAAGPQATPRNSNGFQKLFHAAVAMLIPSLHWPRHTHKSCF